MADENDETPKIIVDSDWKDEARKEKEEMDRETRDMPRQDQIPDPSFVELVQMILLQASIRLGGVQDPHTGQQIPQDLPVAKHFIDLLELLQRKTANNLDENEKALIDTSLHELRMAFVHATGVGSEKTDESQTPST